MTRDRTPFEMRFILFAGRNADKVSIVMVRTRVIQSSISSNTGLL